jgi:hypothetical protein
MTTTPDTPADAPLSIDDAVGLLAVEPEEEEQAEAEPKPAPKAEAKAEEAKADKAEDSDDAESDDDDIDLDALLADDDAEESPAEPEIQAPQSWSKEDREAWAKLTPEARAVVSKREADRDRAVSQAVQKAAELGRQVQQYADQVEQYAALGADAFEARWQENAAGPIDWASAMRSAQTPEEFDSIQRNKAVYDAEKAEVERARKTAAEQSNAAHSAFLAEEAKKLPELAPELVDPERGEARRKEVAEFLFNRGIDAESLRYASAAELGIASLALDGLKYREAQAKARAKAKAAPVTQPTNAKPAKAISPGAQASFPTKQRALQGLETRLTRSGSIDDATNLLLARDKLGGRAT